VFIVLKRLWTRSSVVGDSDGVLRSLFAHDLGDLASFVAQVHPQFDDLGILFIH